MSKHYAIIGGGMEEFDSREAMTQRLSRVMYPSYPWWTVPYKVTDGKWGYLKMRACSREDALLKAEAIHNKTYRGPVWGDADVWSNKRRVGSFTHKLRASEKRKITYDEPFIIHNERDLDDETRWAELVGDRGFDELRYTQGCFGHAALSRMHDVLFDIFENEGS